MLIFQSYWNMSMAIFNTFYYLCYCMYSDGAKAFRRCVRATLSQTIFNPGIQELSQCRIYPVSSHCLNKSMQNNFVILITDLISHAIFLKLADRAVKNVARFVKMGEIHQINCLLRSTYEHYLKQGGMPFCSYSTFTISSYFPSW